MLIVGIILLCADIILCNSVGTTQSINHMQLNNDSCELLSCHVIEIPYGHVECTDDGMIGSECSYSCDSDYKLIGTPTIKCLRIDFELPSGESENYDEDDCLDRVEWSSPVPFCAPLFCSSPPNVPNAGYSCTRELKWGSVCNYMCDQGYRLLPPNHSGVLCYKNNTWLGSRLPVCQRDIICPTFASIDLVIAMDSSETINFRNWGDMKRFVEDIVRSYYFGREGMRIGVYQFDYSANNSTAILLNQHTNNNDAEFISSLNKILYQKRSSDATDILGALEYAFWMFNPERGDRANATNVLLLISDGISRSSRTHAVIETAERLRSRGTVILVIAVISPSGDFNRELLTSIAGSRGNVLIPWFGFERLQEDFISKVSNILCP